LAFCEQVELLSVAFRDGYIHNFFVSVVSDPVQVEEVEGGAARELDGTVLMRKVFEQLEED